VAFLNHDFSSKLGILDPRQISFFLSNGLFAAPNSASPPFNLLNVRFSNYSVIKAQQLGKRVWGEKPGEGMGLVAIPVAV
jgi:hypothetical protein